MFQICIILQGAYPSPGDPTLTERSFSFILFNFWDFCVWRGGVVFLVFLGVFLFWFWFYFFNGVVLVCFYFLIQK